MKLLRIISEHWLAGVTVFLVVAGSSFFMINRGDSVSYNTVIAERGGIRQEVSVTGKVKPISAVDLAFEKTGRISRIYSVIGDEVISGKILAELDRSELLTQLAEARASLDSRKAKLAELEKGTRPEELQVQEVKVANAETAMNDARQYLIDKIRESYTKSDDAVRNTADQFFSNPRSADPKVNFSGPDASLKTNLEASRVSIEKMLVAWDSSLLKISAVGNLDVFESDANRNLNQVKVFLDNSALAVNGLTAGSVLSQATIDGWKSDLSAARTAINTALANLTAALEKNRTAQSSLDLEKNELLLKKSGTVPEVIFAQKAEVNQASAKIENIQAQIEKTILRSPISGTVVRQDAKVGEIVAGNTNLISVISGNDLKIEANIPEVDIGKLKIGNYATLVLDAFPGEYFSGKLTYIDPGETMIEGVTTYKVTLQFDKEDSRIRSGMTADIDILTAERNDAIVVPQRAVVSKNGDRSVSILVDGTIREINVSTGIRSFEGMIEITGGLSGGEEVVVSEK